MVNKVNDNDEIIKLKLELKNAKLINKSLLTDLKLRFKMMQDLNCNYYQNRELLNDFYNELFGSKKVKKVVQSEPKIKQRSKVKSSNNSKSNNKNVDLFDGKDSNSPF